MASSHPFARGTPESRGVPSRAIHAFVDALDRKNLGLHSLMLLRHGVVIAEGWWDPYHPRYPHMLFSLSKSFTSTAIGLLVAEEQLTIDDPVLQFFADEAPDCPGAHLQAMQVRHLLTMTTGHDSEPERVSGQSWTSRFLAHPVTHEPGTHFLYNTAATHMLSAIVQRLTGRRLLDYLQPRLFGPLGIDDATWEMLPPGVDAGGYGLSITTEDIARFGQLYLQQGVWHGAQLIPKAWVEAATRAQVPNSTGASGADWAQGYGYQFWRCRHDAYRGDGAFGQFCVVIPEHEAVLAITAGTPDMQGVLNLVWKHLLPAMASAALPEDVRSHGALAERLAGLRLPPQAGRRTSPVAAAVAGEMFPLPPNEDNLEAIGFDFAGDDAVLAIKAQPGELRIPCGYGVWSHRTVGALGFDPAG